MGSLPEGMFVPLMYNLEENLDGEGLTGSFVNKQSPGKGSESVYDPIEALLSSPLPRERALCESIKYLVSACFEVNPSLCEYEQPIEGVTEMLYAGKVPLDAIFHVLSNDMRTLIKYVDIDFIDALKFGVNSAVLPDVEGDQQVFFVTSQVYDN